MSFLQNLRLMRQSGLIMEEYKKDFYTQILGHSKIIAYENGLPVYSLIFPAFLSSPYGTSALSLTLSIMKNINFLYGVNIAMSDICNANCSFCYFNDVVKSSKQVMSTEQYVRALKQCEKLNVPCIYLVGGEPLLNKDLVSIIEQSNTYRTCYVLYTNGSLLEKYAAPLSKAGLKRVLVSLEYADAGRHNAITGHHGLYDKVMKGIVAAQKAGMLVGLSTTIHPDTTFEDLEKIFQLCNTMGLVDIYMSKEIDPAYPGMVFNPETDKYYPLIKKVNESKSYKFGILYYPYTMSDYGYGGCTAGASRLYISPYGDVTPCDVMKQSFGNIKTDNLHEIWYRMSRHGDLNAVQGPCRRCLDLENKKPCAV